MTRKIVHISDVSRQAKYRQIINSIKNAVASGRLKRGDKVPSINDIANEYGLSRDTVMLAFNELKARGILSSVPGIGYFVESTNVQVDQKIFLLFDEFNSFKETLYNSFLECLSDRAQVDIFFHHFNKQVFDALIRDNASRYTDYIILPGNLSHIAGTIATLPADKVIILDQLSDELKGLYPAVYQSFEEDIYDCLKAGWHLLQKYSRFVLVFPGGKEPFGFVEGFRKFCDDFRLENEVIMNSKQVNVRQGDVYVLPNDEDLVKVVKACFHKGFILGSDVGIISINDISLKEIVAGGISTISTDFKMMGKTLAKMVMENDRETVRNPSRLILRNSL
jgi:DNA-binding transcriptional regulator YhcF (GntR family)